MVLVSFCAKAQLYSSEACFYIETGKSLESARYISVILFKGDELYTVFKGSITDYLGMYKTDVLKYIKEDPSFFDYLSNNSKIVWEYDSSLSTMKRIVYKRYQPANSTWASWGYDYPAYMDYLAISPDKSSFIRWKEEENKIGSKSYYMRINKSELLPKAVNRDFLYE